MKRLHLYLFLLLPILLAGCQTVTTQDRAVLREHNVPSDVYDKMLYGDPLSPDDVIVLSQRAVPSGLIIHYMDETDVSYRLPKPLVKRLRAAGVSEEVIAYMLSTVPQYGPGPYPAYSGGYPYPEAYPYGPPYGAYGYDPNYYGYPYGGPIIIGGGYGYWHGRGGWGRGGWGRGGWGHHH